MDIKELQQKRDKETTGFFWLGLQIAFIFGIPAFIAGFLGKNLAQKFDNPKITFFCLTASFIFSWVMVAIFYHKKSKKISIIENQILELRKKEDSNKNN